MGRAKLHSLDNYFNELINYLQHSEEGKIFPFFESIFVSKVAQIIFQRVIIMFKTGLLRKVD